MPILDLNTDPPLSSWPGSGLIGILDLEYTAWEGSAQRRWNQSWEWREIVQIGFLLVDSGKMFSVRDSIEIMVQPTRNPELSDYFVSLTGISRDQLTKESIPFPRALEMMSEIGNSPEMIIFNGNDGQVLRENCQLNSLCLPLPEERMFNFRPLLAQTLNLPQEKLVSSDLPNLAEISIDGHAHSALHDCKAIAAALAAWRKKGRL